MPMVVEQNTYKLFQRYIEKAKLLKYSYNNTPEWCWGQMISGAFWTLWAELIM